MPQQRRQYHWVLVVVIALALAGGMSALGVVMSKLQEACVGTIKLRQASPDKGSAILLHDRA